MKVILLENLKKIGSIGEIIDVKRGFARNYLIEEAIYEDKIAALDNSLISNIGYINPQFLNSSYDNGRKYSVPLTWGGIGILYRKDKFDKKF